MLLENCQTAGEHFNYLNNTLKELYPQREANTIATYIFEDLFQPIDGQTAQCYWSLEQQVTFEHVVKELRQNRPWQYVVGRTEFYGLPFHVNEHVLIPRPETEELVHLIIKNHDHQPLDILDVGTGSGCIAVTLKKNLPETTITALDISEKAIAVAQKNAAANAVELLFLQLNILESEQTSVLPQYDLIVSNPPYIPLSDQSQMHANVLQHEPHLALFVVNDDPLQFYKVLATLGQKKLYKKGWLYVEIHEEFGEAIVQLFQSRGYNNCQVFQDMYGKNRIVVAQL